MERRTKEGTVELRDVGDEGHKSIRGVAAVYYDGTTDTEFRLWDGAVERIMPGAFDGIEGDDVRALFNHDPNHVLGRQKAGTLSVRSEKDGLHYEITPSDTTTYRDVTTYLARGDVSGSSFSFAIRDDGESRGERWFKDTDRGVDVREITSAKTYDVGPVTFPAYEATQSGVRQARESYERYQSESQRESDEERRQRDKDRQKNVSFTLDTVSFFGQ